VIPLRDHNPSRTVPFVTYGLIALNALVFFYQASLGAGGETFIKQYGLVPYYLTQDIYRDSYVTLFTSMFLHGGFLHIAFNMWSLHIFGDNVEDALGHVRYLVFYLLTGLCAAGAQILVDPASTVPMVGASGAISGVLGAYLRLYPRARIVTLIPVFVLLLMRELPAVLFIVIWFLLQLFGGIGSLGITGGGGIAFFAHIGGFLGGLALVFVLGARPHDSGGFQRPRRSGYGRFDA
jgi:membrane associated rhomboid family serine protease